MKNIILTATIGIVFISAVTSIQGRSFFPSTNSLYQQTQQQNSTVPNPQKNPKKKGGTKKSNSTKPIDNKIAVGDSSTQYRKANTDVKNTTKSEEEKQKQPNTNETSPK